MDVTDGDSVQAGVDDRARGPRRHRHRGQQRRQSTIVGAAHEISEDDWDRELADQPQVGLSGIPRGMAAPGGSRRRRDSQYRIDRGTLGDPRRRRLLRVEGRRDHADQVHGARRRPAGIRVNCVCPGLHRHADDQGLLRRPARPRPARASRSRPSRSGVSACRSTSPTGSSYLASDEARWVTGTALVVDGGLTSGIWGG